MLARTLALAAVVLLAACPKGSQPMTEPAPGGGPGTPTEPGPGTPTEPGPGTPAEPGPGTPAEPGPGKPGHGSRPDPGRPAPVPGGPKLGEPCGAGDACGEGKCVSYYGIAGPRGPQFKSCEIRCDAKGGCAGGRQCVAVADGPGMVCR